MLFPFVNFYCINKYYKPNLAMPGTGSAESLKRKPRQCLIDDRGARILGRLVNSDRKAPLQEITARFNEIRDLKVSARTESMRRR